MTAAEQLAAAYQRMLEEVVEAAIAKRDAMRRPAASLTCKQVAEILGYTPSFVLRLAKSEVLKSDGEGRGRRYRPEYVEDFQRRLKAKGGRIWDLDEVMGGAGAATAAHQH
jgi:hypothetical protein